MEAGICFPGASCSHPGASLPSPLPAQPEETGDSWRRSRDKAGGDEGSGHHPGHSSALPQRAALPSLGMAQERDRLLQQLLQCRGAGMGITARIPSFHLPFPAGGSCSKPSCPQSKLLLAPAPSPFFLHCPALEQKGSDKDMKKQDLSLGKPKFACTVLSEKFPWGKMMVWEHFHPLPSLRCD